jgi:poly(3-hydroxybutyrate) depolymerase
MLYSLVEMSRLGLTPLRAANRALRAGLALPGGSRFAASEAGRSLEAWSLLVESMTRYYGKPEWHLDATRINAVPVEVTPRTVWSSPWVNLVHFARNPEDMARARGLDAQAQPRLLICAPLSGHYATLLRGTVEAFLPDYEVYITDWVDARMVPLWQGRFDLDDYIAHVIRMISAVGPGAHVLAVCQPGPPVLAAIALMSEDGSPDLPATMTYMGSPIDARRSPTIPNRLAEERSFSWFEENMIHTVPGPYPGVFRRVYPGFVQLASFMNMNWQRHVDAQWGFFNHLVKGDGDSADKHRAFYDEYLSVLDLTSEFYLQTITRVFQEHQLARGQYRHRGRLVRPEAITRTALMTVEGELDDISGIGQTQAAHDLCTGLTPAQRADYVQPGVGHYGVFNGNRFRTEIVPRVSQFHDRFTHADADEAATPLAPPRLRVV